MTAHDWFERLTGFRELPYEQTRARLEVRGDRLRSLVDGRSHGIGELELPSVAELRTRALGAAPEHGSSAGAAPLAGRLRVSNVSGNVRAMHADPMNRGALFQVASQFNLLEMVDARVTPEHGVTRYAGDGTQGPACAIAAGAATIYRNYFVPVAGVPGQTATRQLDGLADLGAAFGNDRERLWQMRNGYALCTRDGLARIDARLMSAEPARYDGWRDLLRIGVHWNVEVTDVPVGASGAGAGPYGAGSNGADIGLKQTVSQVFCSALPVRYTAIDARHWRAFASLVLEGAYEATMWAAVVNAARGGSRTVFLTRVGGGAFGNDHDWIHSAIRRALGLVQHLALDVRLVSHGSVPPELSSLAREFA